jgi:hypothetical protein
MNIPIIISRLSSTAKPKWIRFLRGRECSNQGKRELVMSIPTL